MDMHRLAVDDRYGQSLSRDRWDGLFRAVQLGAEP